MLETLVHLDEALSIGFHNGLSSSFSDAVFGFLSDLWFWVPYFVFLALLIYGQTPKRAFLHWFFLVAGWFAAATLASFLHILIFQLSSIDTADLLFRMRPGRTGSGPWQTTFPDPHITSFMCITLYLWVQIFKESPGLRFASVVIPVLFALAEIYTYRCFSLDILTGVVTGLLCGVAVVIVARGIENSFLYQESP